MKFTLIKSLQEDKHMKPILIGLLGFILLYTIADLLVKHFNLGLSPEDIQQTLFGDEELFLDPLNQSSFLELWHTEIFFTMMLLLTLGAVFIRVSQTNRLRMMSINILMLSAILSLTSLFLAYFLRSEFFVQLYAVLFILWHLSAVYMGMYSLWKLFYDKSI